MQTSEQLSLLAFGGLDNTEISEILAVKASKDKAGNIIGQNFSIAGTKDLATRFDLKGKANREELEAKVLARRDMAMQKVKSAIAGLTADWTFKKAATRELANGTTQLTIVAQKIRRQQGPSDEAISKALGITLEEVKAMRKRQQEKVSGTVDVDATVSPVPKELAPPSEPAPALEPQPGVQPEGQTMTDEELERLTNPETVTA